MKRTDFGLRRGETKLNSPNVIDLKKKWKINYQRTQQAFQDGHCEVRKMSGNKK